MTAVSSECQCIHCKNFEVYNVASQCVMLILISYYQSLMHMHASAHADTHTIQCFLF